MNVAISSVSIVRGCTTLMVAVAEDGDIWVRRMNDSMHGWTFDDWHKLDGPVIPVPEAEALPTLGDL